MCGIAGMLYFDKRDKGEFDGIHSMAEVLRHRGPDDCGYYNDDYIALGHRRLSIIDLQTGSQPMPNEDSSLWIVFNGEIYNYKALRGELEPRHKFRTQSDTEVILHLYEELGVKCVDKLRGMFAFAVWDKFKRNLFVARDRLGKKPIYFYKDSRFFLFASEIKSIIASGKIKKSINSSSILDFLKYRYIPAPNTVYEGVCALEPSGLLIVDNKGRLTKSKYWAVNFTDKLNCGYQEAKEMVRDKLTESVKMRLVSDVPVGAFLSGGVDSAVIVGLMSKLQPKPVKTFTVVFDDDQFSEAKYAKEVSQKFGTDHSELKVGAVNIENLSSVLNCYGQPYADPSALPSYIIAQNTSKYVKVVLNGDGGDEAFAGYLRYRALLASEYLRLYGWLDAKFFRGFLSEKISAITYKLTSRDNKQSDYAARFISALGQETRLRNARWHTSFDNNQLAELLTSDFAGSLNTSFGPDYLTDLFSSANSTDTIDRALEVDYNSYLPNDLLVKMDIACMANSLESRSPFLDQEFVELAAKIPSKWKVGLFDSKIMLKDTFSGIIPESISKRQKAGFGLPLDKWFRNELYDYVNDVLLAQKAINRGYFNKAALLNILDEHKSRQRNHGLKIWTLLCLELWHG